MAAATAQVMRHPAQAAAALQPVRLRLLEELREPAPSTVLVRRVSMPRQQANYLLRELERHGAVCPDDRGELRDLP